MLKEDIEVLEGVHHGFRLIDSDCTADILTSELDNHKLALEN